MAKVGTLFFLIPFANSSLRITYLFFRYLSSSLLHLYLSEMGHLHDDVFLLLRPEFRFYEQKP